MTLIRLKGLTNPQSEPQSDWALLSGKNDSGQARIWLAYACERDFLSVPRTHQIIEFSGDQELPLEVHQMPKADYLQEAELMDEALDGAEKQADLNLDLATGIYYLPSEEGEILLFIDSETVLEIACAAFRPLNAIYHQQDANHALLNLLAKPSE